MPAAFSWKYFFKLVFWCSLIIAVVLSVKAFPALNSSVQGIEGLVTTVYPPDLVVTIKDGQASSNAKEAVVIPMPLAFPVQGVENLAVINTNMPFSFEELQKSKALFFLAQDAFATGGSNGGGGKAEVVLLKDIPAVTFTKAVAMSLASSAATFIRYLLPVLGIFMMILFFILLSMNLLLLLLGAFVLQGVAKLRGLQLPYAAAYQAGLHALTLVVIWDTLHYIALPPMGLLWSLLSFFVLILGVALLNIQSHAKPQRV